MQYFSTRMGLNHINRINETSFSVKERIWNTFYKEEFDCYDTMDYSNYTTGIEDMMIEMGVRYEFPKTLIAKTNNADRLYQNVVKSNVWFRIYDFIEKYLHILELEKSKVVTSKFNRILEEEVSAYRILDGIVVPIVNEQELTSIHSTIKSEFESVSIHMGKAIELYAERQHPDYENSIKESISAVEAMCNIITGTSGSMATLGNTLKQLKENGISIHPAMENAFKQLYGYTSDASGIRHGSMEFENAPAEDAKYMIVTCSAFVNYLMEKWIKVK